MGPADGSAADRPVAAYDDDGSILQSQQVAALLPKGAGGLDVLLETLAQTLSEAARETAAPAPSEAVGAGSDQTDRPPEGKDTAPGPLPFDPLSAAERGKAIAVARQDALADSLLSDRYETIGAALYTHKSMLQLETWPRMAEVWFYDYGLGQTLRALVDLGLEETVQTDLLDVQPPLTGREIARAGDLALADAQLLEWLGDAGIDPGNVEVLARLWTGTAPTACPEHRCVLVGLVHRDAFLGDLAAVVDLTDARVVGLLDVQHQWAAYYPGGSA